MALEREAAKHSSANSIRALRSVVEEGDADLLAERDTSSEKVEKNRTIKM